MITEKVLTEEFEKYRPHLKSFILRMTANIEDTKDIVQETYIKAFKKLQTFRSDSSLKTWIFSIATNICKDFLRSKKLWPDNVTDIAGKSIRLSRFPKANDDHTANVSAWKF